jgi:hypothetical protein
MPIRRARKEAKQPFQDITDQFTTVPDSQPPAFPSLNIPTPKPKRKARTPGGTLGAKLRAVRTPAIPSSLPPSSPPSTSSRFPWGEEDPEQDENVQPPQHILTTDDPAEDDPLTFEFDLPPDDNDNQGYIDEAPEEWVQDEPTLDAANMSDPFGFFAVEKKLKAHRAANPTTVRARYRTAPPPVIDTVPAEPVRDSLATPPTPHKRGDKRRAIASPNQSSAGFFNPNTSSMPSTPSPSKPASSKATGKARRGGDNSDSQEGGDDTFGGEMGIAKTRASKRLVKKPRNSESPLSVAGDPHTPLVERPTRRATATRKHSARPRTGDQEDILELKAKKKVATAGTRKKSTAAGKQVKGKGKEDADDSHVDQQEVHVYFTYYVRRC